MRNPEMTDVAWIFDLMSSLPRLSNSAARMTTEVVPSPTSLSWSPASSTRTLPAGCLTSSAPRIVAPSFVTWTSPMSSTSILSSPVGPSDDRTTSATAHTASTFCERTSWPCVRFPASASAPSCCMSS
eukprot:Amastigsp_a664_855.p4 type:complete len:128 gc:universal Amastigsp_a664_855:1311-1694(+)